MDLKHIRSIGQKTSPHHHHHLLFQFLFLLSFLFDANQRRRRKSRGNEIIGAFHSSLETRRSFVLPYYHKTALSPDSLSLSHTHTHNIIHRNTTRPPAIPSSSFVQGSLKYRSKLRPITNDHHAGGVVELLKIKSNLSVPR